MRKGDSARQREKQRRDRELKPLTDRSMSAMKAGLLPDTRQPRRLREVSGVCKHALITNEKTLISSHRRAPRSQIL